MYFFIIFIKEYILVSTKTPRQSPVNSLTQMLSSIG